VEEFRIPPPGGLDWRLPRWLEEKIKSSEQKNFFLREPNYPLWSKFEQRVICMRNFRGSQYYDNHRVPGEASFDRVLRDVWHTLFRPSPPIAALIEKHMMELQLQPGTYMAAHVRALYVANTIANHEEENALRCASKHRPPIYFASDSRVTTQHALEYGRLHGLKVVARLSDKDPFHLDRGKDLLRRPRSQNYWKQYRALDFYDIFVDLYLLASAIGVVHGAGGFGKLGNLLSHEQCGTNHRKQDCNWTFAIPFQN